MNHSRQDQAGRHESDAPSLPSVYAASAPGSPPPRSPLTLKPAASKTDRQIPDALALLNALRRRWFAALCLGIVLAAITAAATFMVVPKSKYVSRALLAVSSNMPRILFPTGEVKVDYFTYQKTQLAMIKSRLVLREALNDPKVRKLDVAKKQGDPVSWLEREVQVEYSGEVLKISMMGDAPEDLPALVNAVALAYLRKVVDVDKAERRKRYEKLKEVYDGYQERLGSQRKMLEKLADNLGSKDEQAVRLTQELALERRGLMEKELLTIQLDLRRAQVELRAQQASAVADTPSDDPPDAAIQEYIDRDKAIAEYKSRRSDLEARLARARRVVRKSVDPSVKQLDNEVKSMDRSIANRSQELHEWYSKNWRLKDSGAVPTGSESLKSRIRILTDLERLAKADVALFKDESKSINKDSMALEKIRDQLSHMEAISKRVGDEVEFLNVELEAPDRVALLESANTPRLEPDRRQTMAGMAGMAAFMVGVVGVSFLEFRARRITSAEQVVGELEMRVMAALPNISPLLRKSKRGTLAVSSATSREMVLRDTMIEAVDSLCATLIHCNRVDGTRVVMVTSAVGSEGKTSLSCSLGHSLARAGRKTLVVDADLRRPAVHRMFDLELGSGLSEVLRNECDVMNAISEVAPGMWVMSAGGSDQQAIQALAQNRLGDLFNRLKQEFDYVVVDTPPILPVADALLIGQHVDAAICAILRDVSRFPRVRAAMDRLRSLEIRVLGAVVAGVASPSYGSKYQYAYAARRGA